MPQDRKKLIRVMKSLKADYNAGKISQEKFRYYYTRYEEKLHSMDTNRKKSAINHKKYKNKNQNFQRKSRDNRLENEKLVQKYIVDPKKNAGEKVVNQSSKRGIYSILIVFILIIGFSAGIGFGVFNLDFKDLSLSNAAAIVEDTAFPEVEIVNTTVTNVSTTTNVDTSNQESFETEEYESTNYEQTDQTNTHTSSQGSESVSQGSSQGSGQGSQSGSESPVID